MAERVAAGLVNLLDLPTYGRYQRTYAEMVAAHKPFVGTVNDRLSVLHLGDSLDHESHALYLQLASSPVPLSEADLDLLARLAECHVDDAQPETIDIRENRAVINRVRLSQGHELLLDTPVDILRLVVAIADGDVSLQTPTRLRSLRRADRRSLDG